MKKKKPITSALDVKSHADACKILKLDPKKVMSIHDQIDNIAKAMNKLDKFKASFKKEDQQKWRAFFYVNASGFRFGHSFCDRAYTASSVGSRLCLYFRTEEISDYFGKQFLALHKKAYNK